MRKDTEIQTTNDSEHQTETISEHPKQLHQFESMFSLAINRYDINMMILELEC